MSTSKFEVERFDGKNDFSLWRSKMMAHLGNLGYEEALKKESEISIKLENKEDVLKKAKNTIILSLSDQVLRKVVKEKTAYEMSNKLE